MSDSNNNLKQVLEANYNMQIENITKNLESTAGNVYIISTSNKKYVLKIYDDLIHTNRMVSIHNNLKNILIPNIIKTNDNKNYLFYKDKFLVLYSFLKGKKIGEAFNVIPRDVVIKLAKLIREMHESTKENIFDLDTINLGYKGTRKSLIHFDLTKNNIFYDDCISIIDFDDAKYAESVYDVAILIAFLFISKKRGINKDNIYLFIDFYYGDDLELKREEVKHIRNIVLEWIDYVVNINNFDSSLKESFMTKKRLIGSLDFESK